MHILSLRRRKMQRKHTNLPLQQRILLPQIAVRLVTFLVAFNREWNLSFYKLNWIASNMILMLLFSVNHYSALFYHTGHIFTLQISNHTCLSLVRIEWYRCLNAIVLRLLCIKPSIYIFLWWWNDINHIICFTGEFIFPWETPPFVFVCICMCKGVAILFYLWFHNSTPKQDLVHFWWVHFPSLSDFVSAVWIIFLKLSDGLFFF